MTLWRFRRYIWYSAWADLRDRYAGSALGVFWNVLTPLAMLTIYTVIFSRILATRIGPAGVLFPLYLASGFLTWTAFADCLARSSTALVSNASYLKRMPIPEEVFVAQSAVASAISMLIAVSLLLPLAVIFAQPPLWTWFLLPLLALAWQLFGFGMGLLLATMQVFLRDVAQVLTVVLQIWMWSVPIVYFEEVLPQQYRFLLPLNPVYPFLVSIRGAYLSGQAPSLWHSLQMLGWIAAAIAVGMVMLRRLRPEIRDVL